MTLTGFNLNIWRRTCRNAVFCFVIPAWIGLVRARSSPWEAND